MKAEELTQTAAVDAVREHGSVRAAATALGISTHLMRKALGPAKGLVFTATLGERVLLHTIYHGTNRVKGRLQGPDTNEIAASLGIKVRAARARLQRVRAKGYIDTHATAHEARHTVTTQGRKVLRLPYTAAQKDVA